MVSAEERREIYRAWLDNGLFGSYKLSKKIGKSQAVIEKALKSYEGKQLGYKQPRKNVPFDKIITYPPRVRNGVLRPDCWYGDLMDWGGADKKKTKRNRGYRYVLVVIDGYSRFVFAKAIKTKSSKDVLPPLRSWLEKYMPVNLTFDLESAIMSKSFQAYVKKKNITFWSPTRYTSQKQKWSLATSMVERAIRSLRTQLYKYEIIWRNSTMVSNLNKVVRQYNNSYHRMIKANPRDVFTGVKASAQAPKRLEHNIVVGDIVRLRNYKRAGLDKRSAPEWSKRIYQVDERVGNAYFIIQLPKPNKPKKTKGKYPYRDLLKVDTGLFQEGRDVAREAEEDAPIVLAGEEPPLAVAEE